MEIYNPRKGFFSLGEMEDLHGLHPQQGEKKTRLKPANYLNPFGRERNG
jgi:hypothetical protein